MEEGKLTAKQSLAIIFAIVLIVVGGAYSYFSGAPLSSLSSQLPAELTISVYSPSTQITERVILNTERRVFRRSVGDSFFSLPPGHNWKKEIQNLLEGVDEVKEACVLSPKSFLSAISDKNSFVLGVENDERMLIYRGLALNGGEYLLSEDNNVISSFRRASSTRVYRCNESNGDIRMLLNDFISQVK